MSGTYGDFRVLPLDELEAFAAEVWTSMRGYHRDFIAALDFIAAEAGLASIAAQGADRHARLDVGRLREAWERYARAEAIRDGAIDTLTALRAELARRRRAVPEVPADR